MSQLLIEPGPDTRRVNHDCADCGVAPIPRCQYRIGDDIYCLSCASKRIKTRSPLHYVFKAKAKMACGIGVIGQQIDGNAAPVEFTSVPAEVTCPTCRAYLSKRKRALAALPTYEEQAAIRRLRAISRRYPSARENAYLLVARELAELGELTEAEADPSEYLAAVEGERHDGPTDEESERHGADSAEG